MRVAAVHRSVSLAVLFVVLCSLIQWCDASGTTESASDGNHSDDEHSVSHSAGHSAHESIIVTLMYPMVILTIGALVEHFFHSSPVPYTVIICLVGAFIGIVQGSFEGNLEETHCTPTNKTACTFGDLSISADKVAEIDPHFLLNLFLPILIFESAFSIDWHVFKNVAGKASLLAGPGLVIGAALTAVWVVYCRYDTETEGSNWEGSTRKWYMGLLFGTIVSATDPVAVVSVLKTVGASKYLSITIEGESLMNDGVAVVAFYVLIDAVRIGTTPDGATAVSTFILMAGAGLLWGFAMGLVFTSWISLAYDQPMVEITVTVMAAYLTYFIGEEYLGVSGVLADVALGVYFSAVGHFSITPTVLHELHGLWEWLGFLANTLVFGITGVLITRPTLHMLNVGSVDGVLILLFNCITLNIALLVIRAIVFLVFYPILNRCGKDGYKMDWRDCFISTWGALRGAVGLALAMVVSLDARGREYNTTCEYNATTLEVVDDGICGGINASLYEDIVDYKRFSEHLLIGVVSVVVFTLLFNSTTIKPLMACLKMNELTDIQLRLFEMAMEKIDDAAVSEINILREDTSLHGVDWDAVRDARYEVSRRNDLALSKKLLQKLRQRRRATIMKSEAAKLEARRRFLAACMSSYHKQNERAILSGRSLRILTEANCEAIDRNCELHHEWVQIVKSVPFLGVVDYMANVEHEDLFTGNCSTMCHLLFKHGWHVFLLLLHLRTRKNKCMNWIVGRFVVSSIGRACDTASAFMKAREEAIDLLRHYLEQQSSYTTFYATAQADMATAARAVLCCQRFFPDIVRSAETNRATRIILYLQKKKTRDLMHEGVLDYNLGNKVVHSLDERIKSVMLAQRLCPKLSSDAKRILLHDIPWLQGLPASVLKEVEKASVSREFKIDDTIVDFGQRPDFIYVIVHGSVSIHMDIKAKALSSSMKVLLDDDLLGVGQDEDEKKEEEEEEKPKKKHGKHAVHPEPHGDETKRTGRSRKAISRRLSKVLKPSSGSSRDLFLGKLKFPVVELHTGSSIGELSWINQRASRTKFCARASSTTVELIGLPIDFVKNNKAIQESLWMTTGRKIVETVLSKQGRFKTWPKTQLVREVSKWKIQQAAKLASQNHYTAVSFCMPVVLMHGEAFKLKHRCRVTQSEGADPTLGDFQVIVTQREMMESLQNGHVLCRLDGPRYLRPHVADDRIDDTAATTVTWYVRSESWLCFNTHARFHYITGAGEAASENMAYSNMRNVFRNFVMGHSEINEQIANDKQMDEVATKVAQQATLGIHQISKLTALARKTTWRLTRRALEIRRAQKGIVEHDDDLDAMFKHVSTDAESGGIAVTAETPYSSKAPKRWAEEDAKEPKEAKERVQPVHSVRVVTAASVRSLSDVPDQENDLVLSDATGDDQPSAPANSSENVDPESKVDNSEDPPPSEGDKSSETSKPRGNSGDAAVELAIENGGVPHEQTSADEAVVEELLADM